MPTDDKLIELLKRQYIELRDMALEEAPTWNPMRFNELLQRHKKELETFLCDDDGTVTFVTNDILYGQDFSANRGVPTGVPFLVEWFNDKHDRVKLTGKHYGSSYDYGNGSIFIFLSHAHEYEKALRDAAEFNLSKKQG